MDQDGNYTWEDLKAKMELVQFQVFITLRRPHQPGRLAMMSGCESRKKRFGCVNDQLLT